MINDLLSILKSSWQQRKTIHLPNTNALLVFLFSLVIGYILFAINAGAAEYKEYHFASEEGAVTALSAIFLAIGAGFAASTFFLDQRPFKSYRSFWLLNTTVLGFLALDELLEFHEQLGAWIMHNTSFGAPGSFRNWNDVIVIGYGVVGFIILCLLLPEILSYPRFLEILSITFLCFFLHTFIDSTTEPRTTLSVILEESFKLLCSFFLMFGMFVGLLGVVGRDYTQKAS